MASRPIKIPGPDHPITIAPSRTRVVVTVAGQEVADSTDALVLQEAAYGPVLYVPRKDVRMPLLRPTDHGSHCPYKGDATYYSIPAGGDRATNAVWTYEDPYPAVAAIRDHVAFYPDRVDEIREEPLSPQP